MDIFTAMNLSSFEDDLCKKIENAYRKFNVHIELIETNCQKDRIRYKVKFKRNMTADDVTKYANEVKDRLKLPLFQVYKDGYATYIVVSEQKVKYPRLPKVLGEHTYRKQMEKMKLPYVVGHDASGVPVIKDLAEFPHLLMGGSTGSGKSVGLQALITSIAYVKDPTEVNFTLIDVGANSLMEFDGLPHLSCSVIPDRETAYNALAALETELDRRVALEHGDPATFKQLPYLVVVIDEFPSLVAGESDKKTAKPLSDMISNLLCRGRHGKIHLVLAAQNPTMRNTKVDLANITARIAFKCAKENYSMTILDEGGAEKLSGKGALLFKSPQTDGTQWAQGIYIKPKEIRRFVQRLKEPRYKYDEEQKFCIDLSPVPLTEATGGLFSGLQPIATASGPSEEDLLLAKALHWTVGQECISTNKVQKQFHLGWGRASDITKRLEELGIVNEPNGKQSRRVLPKSVEDLSDELVGLMECCGYSRDALSRVFQNAPGQTAPSLPRCHVDL